MVWSWRVSSGPIRNAQNFNLDVTLEYSDGTVTYSEQFGAIDLTLDMCAEQARKRIKNVLIPGDAAMAALSAAVTDMEPTDVLPSDPPVDKQQALQVALLSLNDKAMVATLKALKDPDVDAALAAVDAAKADLAAAAAPPLKMG